MCELACDRQFPGGQRACSTCVRTHCSKLFNDKARRAMSATQKCGGSEERIWICPHRVLDYNQVKAAEEYFRRPKGLRPINTVLAAILAPCKDLDHFVSMSSDLVQQWRPVLYINNGISLRTDDVLEALNSLDVRICPHIRTTNQVVHILFLLDYAKLFRKILVCSCKLDAIKLTS